MTDWRGARPGGHPGTGANVELVTPKLTTFNSCFRRLVRHACSLGPRVIGEILLRLVPDRGALIRELQRYAGLDPAFVKAVGGRDWIDYRDFVRGVPDMKREIP
jgi:hypothetical protein